MEEQIAKGFIIKSKTNKMKRDRKYEKSYHKNNPYTRRIEEEDFELLNLPIRFVREVEESIDFASCQNKNLLQPDIPQEINFVSSEHNNVNQRESKNERINNGRNSNRKGKRIQNHKISRKQKLIRKTRWENPIDPSDIIEFYEECRKNHKLGFEIVMPTFSHICKRESQVELVNNECEGSTNFSNLNNEENNKDHELNYHSNTDLSDEEYCDDITKIFNSGNEKLVNFSKHNKYPY